MDILPTAAETDAEVIADLVRALMERKGLPKEERSRTLATILDLSVQQCYKYLKGRVELTVSQLRKIAGYFDVPLEVLLPISGLPDPEAGIEATLLSDEAGICCTVWTGTQVVISRSIDWIAYEKNGRWYVDRCRQAPTDRPIFFVEHIEVTIDRSRAFSVAVLDDSQETTKSICSHLESAGFNAEPFYTPDSVKQALQTKRFDCYIFDWLLSNGTSQDLIHTIRAELKNSAPIFLLTGEWDTGRADKTDIQRAVASYNLIAKIKPVHMDILVAEIYSASQKQESSD